MGYREQEVRIGRGSGRVNFEAGGVSLRPVFASGISIRPISSCQLNACSSLFQPNNHHGQPLRLIGLPNCQRYTNVRSESSPTLGDVGIQSNPWGHGARFSIDQGRIADDGGWVEHAVVQYKLGYTEWEPVFGTGARGSVAWRSVTGEGRVFQCDGGCACEGCSCRGGGERGCGDEE